MNILKKLAHTTWGASRSTMLKLYKATVLSILEYGSPIYTSASESVLKTLEPVHHLGLRLATGAFRSSPTNSLIVESGDLPLKYRFQISTMKRGLKLKYNQSPVKRCFSEPDIYLNTKVHPPFPVRTNRLLEINNLNEIEIYNYQTNIPPWILKRTHVCDRLRNLPSRKYHNPNILKQETLKHMKSHDNYFPVYTDGSKSSTGVGFATICSSFTKSTSLPSVTSVYTAKYLQLKQL